MDRSSQIHSIHGGSGGIQIHEVMGQLGARVSVHELSDKFFPPLIRSPPDPPSRALTHRDGEAMAGKPRQTSEQFA